MDEWIQIDNHYSENSFERNLNSGNVEFVKIHVESDFAKDRIIDFLEFGPLTTEQKYNPKRIILCNESTFITIWNRYLAEDLRKHSSVKDSMRYEYSYVAFTKKNRIRR